MDDMAKVLCKKTPLSANQLNFLRVHILRERKKAKEALGEIPVVAAKTSPLTSVSEDSENESPTLDSQEVDRGCPSTDQLTSTGSTAVEQPDTKTVDRLKDSEQETVEDITKQIGSLQSHLDSLKAEKHRLFQQLKMVLHEEDEKKRMKEMEQKQELEKSMTGGDFPPPQDPRLAQASSLGKHSHPGSPTTATPLMKKQTQRGPLLPTPEGGLFLRQGSTGPYNHQAMDSYHGSSRPPFPPPGPHHFAGGPPPGTAGQRTPYQDQRVSHVPQDAHMQGVHGPRPPIPPQGPVGVTHGMTYMQQPQYQGHQALGTGYQYSTTPYNNLPNSGVVQQLPYPQPQPQQMAPPIPPQGYQTHMSHQQVYTQPPPNPGSHDLMMAPTQGQYQTHEVQIQGHPHYNMSGKGPGAPMVGGSGPSYSEQLVSPYGLHSGSGSVQDPRQQKLLMEQQQRAVPGGAASALKPPFTKQESHQNSPAPSAARDHKHD